MHPASRDVSPALTRLVVRAEGPGDRTSVVRINDEAFAGTTESRLVTALTQSGRPVISLVACIDDEGPVGHILFSPIHIRSLGVSVAALALAPMAVLPAFQRRGIGSRLVGRGLEVCASQGCQVVVVVGHPGFYARFGFLPARRLGLDSVYSTAGDAFMALELPAGALAGRGGFVEYPEEFERV